MSPAMRRTVYLSALAGIALLLGFGAVFLLPERWFWRPAPEEHAGHGAMSDGPSYACPMFCVVMDEKPADGRCPVCGMELGEVGQASVVDAHERMMIGLELERLAERRLERRLDVWGEVAYEEGNVSAVTARASGWISELAADSTWSEVEAGTRLFDLEAPEVTAALDEYLVARRAASAELARAQRTRLELLGVDPRDIEEAERGGAAPRLLPVRAPRSGVIVRRGITEGDHVKTGQELLVVADLDRVRVELEVFEPDAVFLVKGGEVRLDPGDDGEPIAARIEFVDPVIDRRSRVLRARVVVANAPDGAGRRRLRIGQRVRADLVVPIDASGRAAPGGGSSPVLALPREAVLSTGERRVAFVMAASVERTTATGRSFRRTERTLDPERLPDRLGHELVELELGPLAHEVGDDARRLFYPVRSARWPVVDGPSALESGWLVATRGAFMLDAQAQLAGAPSLFFPEGSTAATDVHAGH